MTGWLLLSIHLPKSSQRTGIIPLREEMLGGCHAFLQVLVSNPELIVGYNALVTLDRDYRRCLMRGSSQVSVGVSVGFSVG